MEDLALGKRHLAVEDIEAAVTSLARASQLLSEQFGETAAECGEAYLYYGKALLEMARLESGILGDALVGGPENDVSQDIEKSEDEAEESQDEENGAELEQEDENSDEPSSLELAWEMLELAKVVFIKKSEETKDDSTSLKGYESKLCDTLLTLGEVSLENENYSQAVEDLTSCLKKQQETLPEDSRCIAETYYQLATALGYQCSFEEAEQALNDAIKVLNSRIYNLKTENESSDKNQKEIVELEELLPLIKEKIDDTVFMKKEIIRKMREQVGLSKGTDLFGLSDSSKTVNSIPVKKRNEEGPPAPPAC